MPGGAVRRSFTFRGRARGRGCVGLRLGEGRCGVQHRGGVGGEREGSDSGQPTSTAHERTPSSREVMSRAPYVSGLSLEPSPALRPPHGRRWVRSGRGREVSMPLNRDVEIHVYRDANGYRLDLRSLAGDTSASIQLSSTQIMADLGAVKREVGLPAAPARDAGIEPAGTGQPLQDVGAALFGALFSGDAFALYRASRVEAERQNKTLRLVLRLPPELAVLPWELLFDESSGDYVCHRCSLVRYVPVPEPLRALTVAPPVHILGMTSLPADLAVLNADDERRLLETALRELRQRGLVSLRWVDGETWAAARDALISGCHVFHFIGHGSFDLATQHGSIFFADRHGNSEPVAAAELAKLLAVPDSPPRLAVLNSCLTGAGTAADAFAGVGSMLVRRIPAVVAMQFPISDDAAITFAQTFYTALARDRGVDEAVRVARIDMGRRSGTFEWATPVLYLRSQDSDLFHIQGDGDTPDAAGRPGTRVVPAELPPIPAVHVGRQRELGELDARLAANAGPDGRLLVLTIGGAGGIGKTALALHWAHSVQRRFPDGLLYVNLRGFGTEAPMDPAEAVRHFLTAFGIDDQRIPGDLDGRTALYRSVTATTRILVLLDNAVDSAQVRPLLPGSRNAVVLVTSRNQLGGLISDGATPVTLDFMSHADALALLTQRLGGARLDADAQATSDLLDFCGGLPLALSIVAARAQIRPRTLLASLRDELTDEGERLDLLAIEGAETNLRAVFSWSYKALTPQAQRLFRLLGVNRSPEVGLYGAASLADLPVNRVRSRLRELDGAHLLDEYRPQRYRLHDLLHLYAAALAEEVDPLDDRQACLRRLFGYYLDTAMVARAVLIGDQPSSNRSSGLTTADAGVRIPPIQNRAEAAAWFDAEDASLLAAVTNIATGDLAEFSGLLAWSVDNVWVWRGRVHEVASIWRNAADAADRRGDAAAIGRANRLLGLALLRLGDNAQARTHLERAAAQFAALGDPGGQAAAQMNLATALDRDGDPNAASQLANSSLLLFRTAADRRGEAHALKAVGRYRAELGEPAEGLADCTGSLHIFQQLDDLDGQADALDDMGRIHQQLGKHDQARELYERALDLYGQVGDDYGRADTLKHLGDARHALGETDSATAAWHLATELFRAQGRHHRVRLLDAT
ncbi:CHAT domain-containing protein [Actinoplanes aureus]|uniref:CHAT domain-containing protein n=1 Tax=Actinoplanes aureus TaxID=2792083 RepID=A0A931G098_9ACTN|nr:CHAT domain-containing protein [Actinoplanes aureus]MBG0566533.1 CHAT domain-containing protein [Actinoplanes aureus]